MCFPRDASSPERSCPQPLPQVIGISRLTCQTLGRLRCFRVAISLLLDLPHSYRAREMSATVV